MKRKAFLQIKNNISQNSIQSVDKIKQDIFLFIAQGKEKPKNNLGEYFDNMCDPNSVYFDKQFVDLMKHLAPDWLNKPVKAITPVVKEEKLLHNQTDFDVLNWKRKFSEELKNDFKPKASVISAPIVFNSPTKRVYVKRQKNVTVDILGVVNNEPNAITKNNDLYADKRENIKEQLLIFGYRKPHYKSIYSIILYQSTTKTNPYYDSIFDQKIRAYRPHWFYNSAILAREIQEMHHRGHNL